MTIESFKLDLKNKTLSESDILNRHILLDNPHIFSGNVAPYASLKTKIGEHFKTDITKIHMVGSAKLGFSIVKKQIWKPFDDDSDIDMVIISENVFDRLWEQLSDINLYSYDAAEQAKGNYKSFLKYHHELCLEPDGFHNE